jgi:ribose-phosphate pyrophosphokinase
MTSEAFSNLRLFTCNSHPDLAQEIAEHMGIELGKATVTKFSDGETSVSIWESVRGKDCFIVQSTCDPVNDNLMELLIMTDALKRASCNSVTAVMPYYGYARQDRKAKARDPITSKLVANMMTAAGIDRVITMDLHASQEQGFFDIPVDHMLGQPMLTDYFKLKDLDDLVIVSPDHGSVTRARNMAKPFNCPIAIIDKRRPEPNKSEIMNIIGEVKGKNCIILDDLIDTAGTICNAAKALDAGKCKVAQLAGNIAENTAKDDAKPVYTVSHKLQHKTVNAYACKAGGDAANAAFNGFVGAMELASMSDNP